MNTAVTLAQPLAIPPSFGLVPTNFAEGMQLANMMAGARLVPAALQKSPADCFMVIQQAIRWDMDPFAVAQECSVIQGKLMYSGKLVAAVINARGNLTSRLSFAYEGEGDERTIIVSGQLRGESEPRTVEVTLKSARTPNQVWTKQPDQQLMYHGTRVWARRHRPELMLGVISPEEFDPPPPKPESFSAPADKPLPQMRPKPAPVEPQPPAQEEEAAAQPCVLGKADGPDDWPIWGNLLFAKIKDSPDVDTINEWILRNADHLDALKEHDETMHKRLIDMINRQIASRTEDGT
jgi:hypothetical protein